MYKDVFLGKTVALQEMMAAREKRVANQKELLGNSQNTLLSATMAIPGPIKNSSKLEQVFLKVINEIEQQLEPMGPCISVYRTENTGCEYYLLTPLKPLDLKRRMIQLEEEHPFGRLVDLDVLWQESFALQTVSREDLALPRRRCLICQKEAKECGRSRAHSIEEMQNKIIQIVTEGEG